jgi:DoxX-like family
MANQVQPASGRNRAYWVGWTMGGLAIAFLLVDSTMKLVALPIVIESSGPLGFPGGDMARGLGTVLLVCTLLYVAPQSAVLGAILLTGR